MEISSHFEMLSFHDAVLACVTREDGSVSLHFPYLDLLPEHPESGASERLDNAVLTLSGVYEERALIWHDSVAPVQHPNPWMPLRMIMHGTREGAHFHFDGFWGPKDWSEWYISADRFTLTGIPVSGLTQEIGVL